jgi:hypothetical protein
MLKTLPMQLIPFHKVTVRAVRASPGLGLKGSRRQRRRPQKAMRLDRPTRTVEVYELLDLLFGSIN